jgi:hypothetical protein
MLMKVSKGTIRYYDAVCTEEYQGLQTLEICTNPIGEGEDFTFVELGVHYFKAKTLSGWEVFPKERLVSVEVEAPMIRMVKNVRKGL